MKFDNWNIGIKKHFSVHVNGLLVRLFKNHSVRILSGAGISGLFDLYSPGASPARYSFHVHLWPIAANIYLSFGWLKETTEIPQLNCLVPHTYHPICRTEIPNYFPFSSALFHKFSVLNTKTQELGLFGWYFPRRKFLKLQLINTL